MALTTYFSFIVKIWRERSLDHPERIATDWQSEVEHIQTGERWCFENVDEMLVFLRRQAEDTEGPAQSLDE